MFKGSCLCGGVRFEVDELAGPFELCHCSRCRRVSGCGHMAGVAVRAEHFRFIAGRELIRHFELPVMERPPAYAVDFCAVCGSVTPPAEIADPWLAVAPGLLEGELPQAPDRHIYVDFRAQWDRGLDALPEFTAAEIRAHRRGPKK
ncbi:MAG: GFA family protein [Myxococcales bacterium]|nr:GFA family protein [Myxococcales bacterium]